MARKPRPKTGEPRRRRARFRIELLPQSVRDEARRLRLSGKTWDEIEQLSPSFAGERLPHSSLHRWWDVCVEQPEQALAVKAERSRILAQALLGSGYQKLEESVRNGLAGEVMALLEEENREGFLRHGSNLGFLLARFRQLDQEAERLALQRQKLDAAQNSLDKETRDAAKQVAQGRSLTVDELNRIRERTFGLPPLER